MYKKVIKLNNKKTDQLKNGQKMCTDTSSRKKKKKEKYPHTDGT